MPTLAEVRKQKEQELKSRNFSLSDFAEPDDFTKLAEIKEARRRRLRKFDEADAFSAEVLARFGYEAWRAWDTGEIDQARMSRYILAERAREEAESLDAYALAISLAGALYRPVGKHRRTPRGFKRAEEILKNKIERANG